MIATCPKCGKPLYILTGCSGVGKATTAGEIQKLTTDYVVKPITVASSAIQRIRI